MPNINFNFDAVYACESKIRGIAELVEQEGAKIQKLIGTLEAGWTGTGAAEYIQYLLAVQKNIYERSQSLYSIADSISGSAAAARAADEEAARQLAMQEAAAQKQACPPAADAGTQASYRPQASPPAAGADNSGAQRAPHSLSGSPLFAPAENAVKNSILRGKGKS